MADWPTHSLIAWTFAEPASLKFPETRGYRGLALLGAVLPDLGNFTLLLGKRGTVISQYLAPLKTPVGITLLIIALSFLVREKKRKLVFSLLSAGACLHIFSDFLVETLNGKVMLFFPFGFELHGFGVFEQGGWIFLLFAGIIALTSTALRRAVLESTEFSRSTTLPKSEIYEGACGSAPRLAGTEVASTPSMSGWLTSGGYLYPLTMNREQPGGIPDGSASRYAESLTG